LHWDEVRDPTPMKAKEETPVPPPASQPEPSAGGEAPAPVPAELAEIQEKYLRLAADFENYKKRSARERTEAWSRAQGDLAAQVLDGLDDLGRFAHVNPADTDLSTLRQGVEMVERKLLKALEGAGLKRIDPAGQPFDPNLHEAVTTQPATGAEQDHTVAAVLQPGYTFGGTLLRPARVVVYTWQAEGIE
jgi:molecular chaperone GrpE